MLKIGCHLSSSKGFAHMGKEILQLGGNVFQFFSRNPRGGQAKDIREEDVQAFQKIAQDNGIEVILAHAPYTLNPCSPKEDIRDFAVRTMTDDLQRMEYLPGNMYNFHPGSHVTLGVNVGIQYIADLLNKVLKPEQSTLVLLETMAGKGSEIGKTFEELRAIIEKVELNNLLGVCLDTCHVFDAGYDIVNNLDQVLDEFDKVIGLDRLHAIHLNDSKNILNSHKDRHEKIGEGSLGIGAVKRIVNHKKLHQIPFFLETPNELDGYAKEIQMIKDMYKEGQVS